MAGGIEQAEEGGDEALGAEIFAKLAVHLGEDVVEHYAHAAGLEQAASDQNVTCWELNRYFERI